MKNVFFIQVLLTTLEIEQCAAPGLLKLFILDLEHCHILDLKFESLFAF